MNGLVSVGITFLGGLLSFFSPCVLPLVPVYIGYLSGSSLAAEVAWRQRMVHALLFVVGFGTVFVALGATAGVLGRLLSPHLPILVQVGGVLLILLGMHLTGVFRLPFLDRQVDLAGKPPPPGYGTSLLVGAAFALGWTPCVGPVLAGALVLAANAQTVVQGSVLLGAYALGLGLPFLAVAAALGLLGPALKKVNRYSRWVAVASGSLLILLGLLISTGLYGALFGQLSN